MTDYTPGCTGGSRAVYLRIKLRINLRSILRI